MTPFEDYLKDLYEIRSTGAAVPETSYYPALSTLLNEIGKTLKPKVRCIINIQNRGAGIPDGGLFTPDQFQKGTDAPQPGQLPSRGAIEVKSPSDDVDVVADGAQVGRYLEKYRQVLVTNYRDFILVGQGPDGKAIKLESYRLGRGAEEFWKIADHPKAAGKLHEVAFEEFLRRVMLHAAPLTNPEDVAWFLASYARTARARIEATDLPALANVRAALEEALGLRFEGPKGEHFFRSTLVQTLFYGIFSSWVHWHRKNPPEARKSFEWRQAEWTLRVPMIRALFHQVADPNRLEPLGIVEILDWTATVLNRVNRAMFFSKFEEAHAVQYFYEPFLEAFDPELRKELGVWYTPHEVVEYMVARVDRALRDELDIPDGLADPRVFVLDPCCGTGAYLVEVLRRIALTLKEKGGDALISAELKRAAIERVFGFEILPAPFVVSHLQIGLMLQNLGAPLSDAQGERVGVYLTNALTGWEPPKEPKTKLLFPELEEERDAAERVKRETPILVILGNPPYNGFASVAVKEERALTEAYRTAKKAPQPQGQGLNDPYVRFWRMAERRIVEMNQPAKGIVCFISNYSWLDGLSFTAMRERFLEAFDRVYVDCLNGDKYKTGKITPDGKPDPSIFSTEYNREGIQLGTAIALLVRKEKHRPAGEVELRHFWGKTKLADLSKAAKKDEQRGYTGLTPTLEMGLSILSTRSGADYFTWPKLPGLFPASFPGVKTSRDDFLVDLDRERLVERLDRYFDPKVSHEEMRRTHPGVMTDSGQYHAEASRDVLRRRGLLSKNVVRYCYRPFDIRWLYWEAETFLVDRKREGYVPHVFEGNWWIEARQKQTMEAFDRGYAVRVLADNFGNGLSSYFPLHLNGAHLPHGLFDGPPKKGKVPNLSDAAAKYLTEVKADGPEPLFFHALAVLHAPSYRDENAGALRQDWPRVPLPKAKGALEASAALGRELAALLDPEAAVKAVTVGSIRAESKAIAVVSKVGAGTLNPDAGELAVKAGWGHAGKGGVCMPGRGRAEERAYTDDERKAIRAGVEAFGLSNAAAFRLLGDKTLDVYLNGVAYWRCVPANVWSYTLGGYQVLKKWLSYREKNLLGRDLTLDEVKEVTNIARRIAAILLLQPALDESYRAVKSAPSDWLSLR